MAPLTVKILGFGNAAKKHMAAFAELPELYQITDSDTADIIDICTPPYLHFPQAKAALLAGSHAIVEKPVCGSLAECDELLELEKQTEKRVCPVFQYRFADHETVRDDIPTRWKRPWSYYVDGWRDKWETALGGCLASHGIHSIDLMLHRYGRPDNVRANLGFDVAVENIAVIQMHYPDDALRTISVLVHPNAAQGGFRLGESNDGYFHFFKFVGRTLRDGFDLGAVGLANARQSLEVLTAAYYSAYTGEPVTLPILPEHPFYRGWTAAFAERASRPDTRSQVSR